MELTEAGPHVGAEGWGCLGWAVSTPAKAAVGTRGSEQLEAVVGAVCRLLLTHCVEWPPGAGQGSRAGGATTNRPPCW
jgi:hypothetical protein